MSVVGIDFGNQNCVISVARKGVIDIVVNEVSNRKTPALVAFDGRERQLGEAAAVRMVSNAVNTIDNIKRMLGRRFSDPDFQRDREMYLAVLDLFPRCAYFLFQVSLQKPAYK